MTTRQIGQASEEQALAFLSQQGLTLLERNYACRHGEIDLIMLDKDTLAFIEVRYRRNNSYGGAFASITPNKQKHIRNTAMHYLQHNKKHAHRCARFDAVGIESENGTDNIRWIKNAFQSDAF